MGDRGPLSVEVPALITEAVPPAYARFVAAWVKP